MTLAFQMVPVILLVELLTVIGQHREATIAEATTKFVSEV
jgi:hypothetical protein